MKRTAIYRQITKERAQQDAQWGGPDHDDEHDPIDWGDFIEKQFDAMYDAWELLGNGDFPPDEEAEAIADIKKRFIKVAALAVAGLESWQRKAMLDDE